jgi:hypothetical protein
MRRALDNTVPRVQLDLKQGALDAARAEIDRLRRSMEDMVPCGFRPIAIRRSGRKRGFETKVTEQLLRYMMITASS